MTECPPVPSKASPVRRCPPNTSVLDTSSESADSDIAESLHNIEISNACVLAVADSQYIALRQAGNGYAPPRDRGKAFNDIAQMLKAALTPRALNILQASRSRRLQDISPATYTTVKNATGNK